MKQTPGVGLDKRLQTDLHSTVPHIICQSARGLGYITGWGGANLFVTIIDHFGAVEEKSPRIVSIANGGQGMVAETVNARLGFLLADFENSSKML